MNSHTLFQLLSDAAGKSFWLLAAALLVMLAIRRGAPALRHFIWLLVLAGLLLLPAAALISPFQSAPAWAGSRNSKPCGPATNSARTRRRCSRSSTANIARCIATSTACAR